jgi:hypothetical protein
MFLLRKCRGFPAIERLGELSRLAMLTVLDHVPPV